MLITPTINSVHGRILCVAGTDPAAGDNSIITVPARRRWRLMAARYSFITDSNVANRTFQLHLDDGTNIFHTIEPVAFQPASTSRVYSYGEAGKTGALLYNTINLPFPRILLTAGSRLRTSINNIQVGDDLSVPYLLVEEWIDP